MRYPYSGFASSSALDGIYTRALRLLHREFSARQQQVSTVDFAHRHAHAAIRAEARQDRMSCAKNGHAAGRDGKNAKEPEKGPQGWR